MESILNAWSKRNLTLFGSVTIIKSLAISKIVFSVQNTYMPPDWIGLDWIRVSTYQCVLLYVAVCSNIASEICLSPAGSFS